MQLCNFVMQAETNLIYCKFEAIMHETSTEKINKN